MDTTTLKNFAQAARRQLLAQVGARRLVGSVRPQQGRQRIAAMGAVVFDGQIGQQRPDLISLERSYRLAVEGCVESAKQKQRKPCHKHLCRQ